MRLRQGIFRVSGQSLTRFPPQHVTRAWVQARGKEVGGEEEEGQENRVAMTPLPAPKSCCCILLSLEAYSDAPAPPVPE